MSDEEDGDDEFPSEEALDLRQRIAFHEAGHVIAILACDPSMLQDAMIDDDMGCTKYQGGLTTEDLRGACKEWTPEQVNAYVTVQVCISVAGVVAQHCVDEEIEEADIASDVIAAITIILLTQQARGITKDRRSEDQNAIIQVCKRNVMEIILREQILFMLIAEALFLVGTLTGDEARRLYEQHWCGPRRDVH